MITPSSDMFPNNVLAMVKLRAELLDSEIPVLSRPLRATDPNQCIGVFAGNWVPNEDSHEMRGQFAQHQPTLSKYNLVVQGLVRHTEESVGLDIHTVLARMLRSMLYTDNPLRVALGSLQSNIGGMTERSKRWGVSQQRFFANDIGGEWLYLSILEFWLETEIT